MEFLKFLLDKTWLKPISVPIMLIFGILTCFAFYPKQQNDSYIKFIMAIIIFILLWISYIIIVIKHNKLPKAKDGTSSVLFIIKSQDEKSYKQTEYLLVERFSEYARDQNIYVICINEKKIKNFDFFNDKNIEQLLIKTNCQFMVYLKHYADDALSASRYELEIQLGILHPELTKAGHSLLKKEFFDITKKVNRIDFEKAETICSFKATANQLAYICKYILGLIFLLTSSFDKAYKLYKEVFESLKTSTCDFSDKEYLLELCKRKWFGCCELLQHIEYENYIGDLNRDHIRKGINFLEEANTIIPDTYTYFLNRAGFYFIDNRDLQSSEYCIKRCKEINDYCDWQYSEAFICAYKNNHPGQIYKKYKAATNETCFNIINVITFIENVLETEPEKYSLHLALGFLYESIGDKELMRYHFNEYIDMAKEDKRLSDIKKVLLDKIEESQLLAV